MSQVIMTSTQVKILLSPKRTKKEIKMRKVLFRGVRVDGEGWIYGFYADIGGKPFIAEENDFYTFYADPNVIRGHCSQFVEVLPKTVEKLKVMNAGYK